MPALPVTWTAPLQLRYAARGAIQMLYAFAFILRHLLNFTSYTYCVDTTIGQALYQVNAGVNLNTAAVDTDVVAS